MADAEASHFIGGPQPRPVAWRGLAQVTGAWVLQGFSMFSVIERSSGRWIGRIGPWRPADWPGPEVGWALIRDAWGQGYAAEGASAAIDWVFDQLGWTEVIHCIAPDNAASQTLARRLGSFNRGPARMPEPYQDTVVDLWGQTRDDWRGRKA